MKQIKLDFDTIARHTQAYYNTNKEQGEVLHKSIKKAATQEVNVLDLFTRHPSSYFCADDVLALLDLNCPITSVRRCLTNLSKQGKLVKTDKLKEGKYGKMTHCYKLL